MLSYLAPFASSDASALFALLAAGTMVFLVVGIVYYVLYIIANWKIFEKAGEKGWKSIIPFYNVYIQFKISWKTTFFWIFLVLILAGSFLTGASGGDSASMLYLLGCAAVFAALIICLIDAYYLSKSFGHGFGYLIGFLFLPWLFALILGFGKSQYIGNAGDPK